MKTVFTTRMCIHVWAQQNQEHGRTRTPSRNGSGPFYSGGGSDKPSLFFEGPTLYSYGYHYVIGHFFLSPDGRRHVVINSEKSSVTTNKHKHEARWAIPEDGVVIFEGPIDRDLALALTRGDYEVAWRRIANGRDAYISSFSLNSMDSKAADKIVAAVNNAATWARALGGSSTGPRDESVAKLVDAAVAYRQKLAERHAKAEAARNDMSPEAVAKRKRDYEKRNAKLLALHNEWVRDQLEALNHWRRFETVSDRDRVRLDYKTRRKLEDMHERLGHAPLPTALRRKDDESEVETSRGARVPWRDAVRLYQFATYVKEGRLAAPRPEELGQRVGHFTLHKVHPNGDVQVGCHFLTYHEMHRLAQQFGVAAIPAIETVEG